MLLRCCKACNVDLPHTLTATPSGFSRRMHSQNAIIKISPCFDCKGFFGIYEDVMVVPWNRPYGIVLSPGGEEDDRGPISEVSLEHAGRGGFARLGRAEPIITISGGSGSGATFTPTYREDNEGELYGDALENSGRPLPEPCDECLECLKVWHFDEVLVGGSGEGYRDGDMLSVSFSPGTLGAYPIGDGNYGTVGGTPGQGWIDPFTALADGLGLTLRVSKSLPEVQAAASGGSGATLTPELSASDDGWTVSSIAVTSGGTGYRDGAIVNVSGVGTSDIAHTPAQAVARTTITQPSMQASVRSLSDGSGASLSVSLAAATRPNGRPAYRVSSVSISNGGAGYSAGDEVVITTQDDSQGALSGRHTPLCYVSAVDGSGAITSLSFTANNNCYFWKDTGVIESVVVANGGRYYRSTPSHVEIQQSVPFYREDSSLPPCVADILITPPGGVDFHAGEQASLRGVVDDDTESPTFGALTGIEIDGGGTNYLGWSWSDGTLAGIDLTAFNGKDLVFRPANAINFEVDEGQRLVHLDAVAQYGCGTPQVVPYTRRPPRIKVTGGGAGGDIEVTLSEQTEEIGENQLGLPEDTAVPYWTIDSVTATGGAGYPAESEATLEADCEGLVEAGFGGGSVTLYADEAGALTHATVNEGGRYFRSFTFIGEPGPIEYVAPPQDGNGGFAVYGREQPSLTFTRGPFASTPVSGVTLTPTFEQRSDQFDRPYWSIVEMAVSGDGTGFSDNEVVWANAEPPNRSVGQGTVSVPFSGTVRAPVGRIRTRRDEPVVSAVVAGEIGSGASLTVSLTQNSTDGPPTWRVSSVAVTAAGSGYVDGAAVAFSIPGSDVAVSSATAYIVAGPFGGVASVVVSSGGQYYRNGPPESIDITNEGEFFQENPELPPHVADVTIEIHQQHPSDGSNAILNPVIDTDTESATFGRMLSVEVQDGGSGYILSGPPTFRFADACYHEFDCSGGERYSACPPYWWIGVRKSDRRAVVIVDQFDAGDGHAGTPDQRIFVSDDPIEDGTSIDTTLRSGNCEATIRLVSGGVLGDSPRCVPAGSCAIEDGRIGLSAAATVTVTVPTMPLIDGFEVCEAGEYEIGEFAVPISTDNVVGGKKWFGGSAQDGGEVYTAFVDVICRGDTLTAGVSVTASCNASAWGNDGPEPKAFNFTTTRNLTVVNDRPQSIAWTEEFDLEDTVFADNKITVSVSLNFE